MRAKDLLLLLLCTGRLRNSDLSATCPLQAKAWKAMAGAQPPGLQLTLEALRAKLAAFAAERDWDQFHSPRNLLLALVGVSQAHVQASPGQQPTAPQPGRWQTLES